MLTRLTLAACALVVLAWSLSCQSVAVFPQCNGERLEPGEECELFMNGESEAEKPCRALGYPSGRRATCDSRNCTWDTSTCTGNVNNVNNFPCDPTIAEPECGLDEVCYYRPNEDKTACAFPGGAGYGEPCFESEECNPVHICLNSVCTRLCDDGQLTCPLDLACNNGFWQDDWGFCPQVDLDCDPFDGSGCPPEGESCYFMLYEGFEVHRVCLHTGELETDCVGTNWNECIPGHTCFSGRCVPLCDGEHPCLDGTCVARFDEVGVCQ